LEDSMSLDQLNRLAEQNLLKDNLFSLSKSFDNLPNVMVENQVVTFLKKSRTVPVSYLRGTTLPSVKKGDFLKASCQGDNLIAIVQSLINKNRFSMVLDKERAWKLVCFFNPKENTLH